MPEQRRQWRMATIGCGRMGARTTPAMARFAPPHLRILSHMEAIRSLDMASALAGCDVVPAALEAAREAFALDFTTLDPGAIFSDFRPGILTLAVRTPQKAALIEQAAAAGIKALHVEKPLCNSRAEMEALETLARRHDLSITSGCLRRYLRFFRGLPDLAEARDLGPVHYADIGMGAGPLMWTQFHGIDLLFLMARGRPLRRVRARLGELEREGDVVSNDPAVLSALFEFEDGFTGHIGQMTGNSVILSCARGQVEAFADGRDLFVARREGTEDPYLTKRAVTPPAEPLSGTEGPLDTLRRALEGEGEAREQVRAGQASFFAAQNAMFAMVESHLGGGVAVDPDALSAPLTLWGKSGPHYA